MSGPGHPHREGRTPPSQDSDEAAPAGKQPLAEQSAGRQIRRGLHTSVVDNSTAFGFSITITCSFGVLSNTEGSPSIGAILAFGLAAAATFTLLHALASDLFRHRPQSAPRQVVILGTALNFLSVGLGVGAAVLVGLLVAPAAAWPLGSVAAASAFIFSESLEMLLAEQVERRRGLTTGEEAE